MGRAWVIKRLSVEAKSSKLKAKSSRAHSVAIVSLSCRLSPERLEALGADGRGGAELLGEDGDAVFLDHPAVVGQGGGVELERLL